MQQQFDSKSGVMPSIAKTLVIAVFGISSFALATQGSAPQPEAPVHSPVALTKSMPSSTGASVDRSLEDRALIEMSVAAYGR
ncbi:MAG: hypothetical protein ACRCV9_09000 [Burkholderiaceae bacterium]